MENKDLIAFMQKYLQINTSHPKPVYEQAIALFKAQALQDGFECIDIILPSGRPVLMVVVRGADPSLPALALNHHMDVVPAADPALWKFAPFAGHIENGLIYGRGTQDMKGVGVVHYGALKRLTEADRQPRRTICLVMVPDEEIGGETGVGQLVKTKEFKKLNIGYVLDEGLPSSSDETLFIKVSDRKPLQIRVTSKGSMAHGSRLRAHNAAHSLIDFLNKVTTFQYEQRVKTEEQPSGLLLSMNVTSLQAGVFNDGVVALNIIPDQAHATLDIRVPPTMSTREAAEMIDEWMKGFQQISYSIEAVVYEGKQGDTSSLLYRVLESAVGAAGLKAQPYFAEGASDLRFYLQEGIEGFGFTPFTIKDNLHGVDEAIALSDLALGCGLMYQILVDFCL